MRAIWAMIPLALLIGCHSNDPENSNAGQPPSAAQMIHLFPTATEVRLFVDTGRTDSEHRMILTPNKGIILTQQQRYILEHSLTWNSNYGNEDIAACFLPHHYFRYFGQNHKILGTIAVCFCCGGVEVTGGGKLIYDDGRLKIDLARVKALVSSMHEPTDIDCDTHGS